MAAATAHALPDPQATDQANNSTSRLISQLAESHKPEVLAGIYEPEINIANWARTLDSDLMLAAKSLLEARPNLKLSITSTPEQAYEDTLRNLGGLPSAELVSRDIAELVDMFCCLFELSHAGIRLTTLDRAMCPRLHVDHVPCRLVTTYFGPATQWLSNSAADRSKLGAGSLGKSDAESGLYKQASDIQQLQAGDVALLKGERWEGNESRGLIHRSPGIEQGGHRLLLTLDFGAA